MSHRRVVITGMGVVTPVGNDVNTFWNNLIAGVSGIGPITQFDATAFDCRIAGEVRGFEAVKAFKTPKDVRGPIDSRISLSARRRRRWPMRVSPVRRVTRSALGVLLAAASVA